MFYIGGILIFCSSVSAIIHADRENDGHGEQELSKFVFGYLEYLETLINRTEDTELKSDISGLFKELVPAIQQIIKIESQPIKLQKLRKLLPELEDIERLLNIVRQRNGPDKSYRIDESPFNKEILLTLYEETDGDKKEDSLPPWYPQHSNRDTTTNRPYKVGPW